jgi:hypothetical protein
MQMPPALVTFSPWRNGVIHLYRSLSLYSVCDLNVEMAMIAAFACYLDSGQLSMPNWGRLGPGK